MRKLYVLIFCIGFLSANAQTKVDSLIRVLPNATSDTARVNRLNQISMRHQNPDEKYNYALRAQALSLKINWPEGIANSQLSKGKALFFMDEAKKSIPVLLNAAKQYNALDKQKESANAYIQAGSSYLAIGNYPKAYENYFHALKMAKGINDNSMIGYASEGVATVYSRETNLSKAIEYGLKALEANRKANKTARIASSSHLLGVSYHLKDDKINAAKYYRESFRNYALINDSIGMATNYSHLGLIEKEKDYPKGLAILLKAQAIFEKIDPSYFNSIQNLGNIGKAYFDLYNSDSLLAITKTSKREALLKAKEYSETTLKRSREVNDVQNMVENLGALSEIQFEEGHFKEAFVTSQEYQKLHDSLFSQDNKNKIAALESAQDIALKDKEIQLNKLAIETREKQKWYLFAGIGSLLIIGSLLFIQSRNRQRTNARLNKLNAELKEANTIKTRFFSILNHDLRGPAASVVNFLRLQETAEMDDEKKREGYRRETISSAEYLLDTMEDLLLWCKGQMENFKPVATDIPADSLFQSIKKHFPHQDQVEFTFSDHQNLILHTDEDYLVTIMRNLTGNAIKSMAADSTLKIEWKAWQEQGKKYLSIADNGTGGTSEKFRALYDDTIIAGTRSGLGLHLIRDLAQAIDCTITLESEVGKGTVFTLTFGSTF